MTLEELLTSKELAYALKRSVTYVYAMRAQGFIMPGGRATLREAQSFLARNPAPRARNNGERYERTRDSS